MFAVVQASFANNENGKYGHKAISLADLNFVRFCLDLSQDYSRWELSQDR
jgi:hypothetical protein